MTTLLCVLLFVTVVLATATLLAAYARLPWRWTQFIVPTLTGWIPAAFCLLAYAIGDLARLLTNELPRRWQQLPTSTLFMVTLIAALVVGLVALPVYGLWRRRVDGIRVSIAARWPVLKLFFAALAGVVLLLATTVAADIRIRGQIAERRAENRAAIERLCSLPVADEDDAAPLLREAYALIGDKDARPVWWDRAVEAGLDVNSPEVSEYLAGHGRSVELAIAASRRPAARLVLVPEDKSTVDDGGEYELIITLGRLLYFTALRRAALEDMPGCIESLDALRRIARQPLSPPTFLTVVSQMGLERSRLKAIETVLASGPLKRSWTTMPVVGDTHSFRPALDAAFEFQGAKDLELICQGMLGEMEIDRLGGEPERPTGPAAVLSLFCTRVLFAGDDLEFFPALVHTVRERLRKSPSEAPEAYEELDRRYGVADRGFMTRMVGAVYSMTPSIAQRTDLTVRLADVGLALAAFQARHGKLPTKLDELVPEFIDRVPVSPYSGQPLRISPDGDGFVVHAGEVADFGFDQIPTLCLGASYTRRRVEPAREDAARFGP